MEKTEGVYSESRIFGLDLARNSASTIQYCFSSTARKRDVWPLKQKDINMMLPRQKNDKNKNSLV